MSKLTERACYLKGLAEGLKLNADKDANRVLLEALDLIEDMAHELANLSDAQDALDTYVDAIDEDLAALEEAVFDDEDEDVYDPDEDDDDDEDDVELSEDESLLPGENEIIVYECPHCGEELQFRAADIDFDEDTICPVCGQSVFPEQADNGGSED